MWLTTAANSVMFYIASVRRKHFVYIISLNQPKVYRTVDVDGQGSAIGLDHQGGDKTEAHH